ncbi:MAG: signal peptidase I [Lentisphaerae bacterium GWF2_44_16]|nr:MAG: signal peptidase I [Lentisphaerae bacterium GWF2_44_16]
MKTISVITTFLLVLFASGCSKHVVSQKGNGMAPTIENDTLLIVERGYYKKPEDIKRFDIIFLETSFQKHSILAIRRVIALPGEELELKAKSILINGQEIALPEVYLSALRKYSFTGLVPYMKPICKLPRDSVYVLGDNIEHSLDSRLYGPVKFHNIMGKVLK